MKNRLLLDYSRESHLLGVIFVVAILLPHVGLLYLINPILLLYLGIRYFSSKNVSPLQWAMIALITVSIIINLLSGVNISSKSLIRTLYIIGILLFFPFCKEIKIPNIYIYATASIILLSQLCYVLNIDFLIDLFNVIYPYTGNIESESVDYLVEQSQEAENLLDFESIRYGGLFHNSNQCMKYMSLCTVAFLLENREKSIVKVIPLLAIVLTSSIFAGSRTGFIVVLLSIFTSWLYRKDIGLVAKVLLSLGIAVCALYLLPESVFSQSRLFQISTGIEKEGSLSLKYANLKEYFGKADSFRAIFFGNISLESIKELYHTHFSQFDSEWGNAIYFYGVPFFLIYTFFLLYIAFRLKGDYRIAAFILLWAISSTILFSYRTSFAFFLLASKYFYASNKQIPQRL